MTGLAVLSPLSLVSMMSLTSLLGDAADAVVNGDAGVGADFLANRCRAW